MLCETRWSGFKPTLLLFNVNKQRRCIGELSMWQETLWEKGYRGGPQERYSINMSWVIYRFFFSPLTLLAVNTTHGNSCTPVTFCWLTPSTFLSIENIQFILDINAISFLTVMINTFACVGFQATSTPANSPTITNFNFEPKFQGDSRWYLFFIHCIFLIIIIIFFLQKQHWPSNQGSSLLTSLNCLSCSHKQTPPPPSLPTTVHVLFTSSTFVFLPFLSIRNVTHHDATINATDLNINLPYLRYIEMY